jgi:hypothetical protein
MAKANKKFREDESALELPINIVVMLVVGVAALAAMLAILGSRPAVPATLQMTVMKAGTSSSSTQNGAVILVNNYNTKYGIYINAKVTDSKGNPVKGAFCVASGLGGKATATSGSDGNITLESTSSGGTQFELPQGMEGSLKLLCTASGYDKYEKEDAVTVIKV